MEGKLLETFVTSSVLIVAVLILRRLCRGKISLCLQYGIWLIVAVKLLLVPAPFWGSSFSVMNLIKTDTQEAPAGRNLEKIPGTDTNSETAYIFYDSVGSDRDAGKADTEGAEIYSGRAVGKISEPSIRRKRGIPVYGEWIRGDGRLFQWLFEGGSVLVIYECVFIDRLDVFS